MDLLYLILDSVKALNVTAQKAVIRSVVNCLLDDGAGLLAKDKTRCLFVLLRHWKVLLSGDVHDTNHKEEVPRTRRGRKSGQGKRWRERNRR